jgi:hypothetical protein
MGEMDEDLRDFDEAVGIHLMNSLNFTESTVEVVEDKSHVAFKPTLIEIYNLTLLRIL